MYRRMNMEKLNQYNVVRLVDGTIVVILQVNPDGSYLVAPVKELKDEGVDA